MAIVTTDDKNYKDIAAAIRKKAHETRQFKPSEMVEGIDLVASLSYGDGVLDGYEDGYQIGVDDGYIFGEQVARAECEAKHHVAVMPGSGTTSLSFHVPFEPDLLLVTGYDPTVLAKDYQVMMFAYDIAAFGLMGGYMLTSYNNKAYSLAMTTVSALAKYSRAADGTVTLDNIKGNNSHPVGTFGTAVQYTVSAVKYTDKTDKERITEMVEGLTGSGSLTMNKSKVNGAFTDEEWAALIATKPDWTFAFVG